MNYLEYYESTALNTQIDDLLCYHKHIGKAIRRLTEIHSDWGCSMVLEGYAIYPDIQPRDNTDAIWLIADEALPADRLDKKSGLCLRIGESKKQLSCARSLAQ